MSQELNQQRAPLYEKMLSHRFQSRSSFHVPGHKNGKGVDPIAADDFASIMSLDYTELAPLDDLHHPTGVILEAQQLASDCFGAEDTYFLVNGSTVGNLAMIMSVCATDEILIVQRNVHKSVIHGLMLAGARAVFLPTRLDADTGLAVGVNLTDVITAMEDHPTAKGVLLSNPNYYGMGIELSDIAAAVHFRGLPLLVDEAHGAHFGFHPDLPNSALASGADAVVQSTHKMLTAMTMGAMLHVQGNRMERDLIRQRLSMLQSSSPSYPLMASLDLCRRWMFQEGKQSITKALQVVRHFREQVKNKLPAAAIIEREEHNLVYDFLDPFKITLGDRTGTWTGFQLRDQLAAAGCDAEMADAKYVLFQFSLASDESDTEHLFSVLSDIFIKLSIEKQDFLKEISNNYSRHLFSQISAPVRMGLPRSSDASKVKAIPIEASIGLRSAEMVIPYPPGIPLLYIGERITEQAATYIKWLAKQGASFQGAKDAELTQISIFIE
jgi:arginine decarboxylase